MPTAVTAPVPAPATNTAFPLDAADRCVMCGLCLPHCPTYRLSLNEGESPRGRIALMSAAARGQLAIDAGLRGHLDRCLSCRACERMCPSGVPYAELLDSARQLLAPGRPAAGRLLQRLALDGVLKQPRRVRLLAAGLRLAQRSGVDRVAPLLGLKRAAKRLPALPPAQRWRAYYPAPGETRGEVALFTGCLGSVLDIDANRAAIVLLNRFGFGVRVPAGQRCCGALHQHSGDAAGAAALASANRRAFAALPVAAIVSTSSACTLTLREYPAVAEPGIAPDRVQEVSAFLAAQPWPDGVELRALPQVVSLHQPCTQVNGLRSEQQTQALLQRIPAIDLRPLPTLARCCGAAGSYMLSQPEMADKLGREVLADSGDNGLLLTSNIGCLLQLQGIAREQRQQLQIMHPLSLLQRQLLPPDGGPATA